MKGPSSSVSLMLALLLSAGCAMKASSKARAPGVSPDSVEKRGDMDDGMHAGDELDQLDAQLRQAEVELVSLSGAGTDGDDASTLQAESSPKPTAVSPSTSPAPEPAAVDAPSRCERVAMLTEQICQLRDRMCALADEHDDEARYSDACARAGQSCEEAEQASDGCEAA